MVIFESTITNSKIIIDFLLLILCLSSVCFYCYAIYAALVWLGNANFIDSEFHPPITIVKPLCGFDSDAYENLASFCQQDYPDYQIIFVVRDRKDPNIEIVNKIIYNYPDLDILLVLGDRIIGTNPKVNNLANGAIKAKHEILFLADSDIRVNKDYLQRVIQPMQDQNVGVVTCPYRSLAQGWVTILEAIGSTTEFHAGVLVSNALNSGIEYAFGSTIAIRKEVLETIGGFEAIADYLADDFQLGNLTAKAGYKVVLSDYIVEHVLAKSSLIEVINRQIRWACGIRASHPWGYLGLIFTYGIVFSLLLLISTGGSTLSCFVLCITWVARLVMAWVVGVITLKEPIVKKFLWIIPLYDLLRFVIWCNGFFRSTIEWRGQRFQLTENGKLVAIALPTQEVVPS
ncbi:putative glycosyl transferase, group 2 family protein [Tolypothrix sp. NIES-4075]|uniref:bacteriohopanetetrol glucosamine biosynthesis glycosyltransferase HpnI n=1 Tax=Tolypothrix sp. NIES-4075 TaxID=2005459 RepID=UPI000B5C1DCF|nr:bacteriohopanetetrol glucosamine biosynthesis glycosyltransferase HpnI [Tolypothrix sp. NIES-4075]GAX41693.1 putative glycosyl transferase, group 2 family protein [Tolypothrix sp. NIES-4075]